MKNVSVREFRDNASYYLASRETISVNDRGKIVEFYIPVKELDEEEVQSALMLLSQTVANALIQSGWDEEKLSQALDLSHSA